jgi:hypothetical protein
MRTRSKFLLSTLVATSVACSPAAEDAAETAKEETGTNKSTTAIQESKIESLNLTGALQLQLPSALTESSSSLRLTGGKSLEACLMRESIKQSKMMLDGITGILCHIEAESSKIEEGKPKLFKLAGMGLRLQDMDPTTTGTIDPTTGGMDPTTTGTIDPTTSGGSGDPTGGSGAPTGGTGGAPEGMGGDQYIGVSMKQTGDVLDVYVCEGSDAKEMKLSQHFKIEGSKKITKDGKEVGASKGEMRLSSDMGGITFGATVSFDAFHTDPKVYDSEFKVRLEGDFGGMGLNDSMKMDMAQLMKLKVVDGGVSTVGLSDRGEMMGFSTKNASIGKFDATHGNVVGSFNQQTFDSDVKACVDNDSVLVDCADAKFQEGGNLYITASEVPSFLPADFAAAKPKGFDCDIDWGTAVEMDPASEGHKACEMDVGSMEAPGCFDGGEFVASEVEFELPDELPEVEVPAEEMEAPAE